MNGRYGGLDKSKTSAVLSVLRKASGKNRVPLNHLIRSVLADRPIMHPLFQRLRRTRFDW